jgi:hypothetical protein
VASADADQLLPSHGPPIIGAARVREALTCTADLAAKPYLRAVYDEPEFIVHTKSGWRPDPIQ